MEEKKWHKMYDKGVPKEIEIPDIPLYGFLLDSAEKYPDNIAFIFFKKEYSYRYFRETALKLANFLIKKGLEKGDRVALLLPNTPQFVIGYYGVLLAGGVCVQINPLLSQKEIEILLEDSESKFLIGLEIVMSRFKNVIKNSSLKHLLIAKMEDYLPVPLNIIFKLRKMLKGQTVKSSDFPGKEFLLWDYIDDVEPLKEPVKVNPKEDIACLQYTGGTTGIPKGAMLTHKNLVTNALQAVSWVPDLKEGKEVMMGVIPFFHVYGMSIGLNFAVARALKIVILPRFSIKEVLDNLEGYKVNLFPGVPQMYQAIISYKGVEKYNLSSIRACISGAAPLPVVVKERFEELTGARLVEGYGLSEASPVTHCNPIYGVNKKGSVGIPFPMTDAKIVDLEKGEKEMKPGEKGELIVKGPQVMKGYWKRDEDTKKVLKGGWLYTGDIAQIDDEGYFYIVDRKKDIIIVSGFNVYPRIIEEIVIAHPKVKEVACIGIPDERRGEGVKLFIVKEEGVFLDKEEIIDYCKKNLGKYEVPQEIEFVKEIPKTAVGKVLRRVLKDKDK